MNDNQQALDRDLRERDLRGQSRVLQRLAQGASLRDIEKMFLPPREYGQLDSPVVRRWTILLSRFRNNASS